MFRNFSPREIQETRRIDSNQFMKTNCLSFNPCPDLLEYTTCCPDFKTDNNNKERIKKAIQDYKNHNQRDINPKIIHRVFYKLNGQTCQAAKRNHKSIEPLDHLCQKH